MSTRCHGYQREQLVKVDNRLIITIFTMKLAERGANKRVQVECVNTTVRVSHALSINKHVLA